MNLKGIDRDKLIDFINEHCNRYIVQPVCEELKKESIGLYEGFSYIFECGNLFFSTKLFPLKPRCYLNQEEWHQVNEARRNALALFLVLIDFKEDFTDEEE